MHRNFKLLADPQLVKCGAKLYRYDGVVPGDPTYPTITPRDPRNPLIRIRARPVDPLMLLIPRYGLTYIKIYLHFKYFTDL